MDEDLSKLSNAELIEVINSNMQNFNSGSNLFELIASNVDIGIIVCNKDMDVVFFNKYFSRFSETFYRIRPHLNMPVSQLFPEEIRDDLVNKLSQCLAGTLIDFISTYEIDNQKYFFRRVYTPIINKENEIIGSLSSVYDLSELYRNKEDLEKFNQELDKRIQEKTAQLQEELQIRKAIETELRIAKEQISVTLHREKELSTIKSKLLDNISHEINTPLTIISSSSFLIENYLNYKQYDEIPKYLNQINEAVKSLNDTVEQASKAYHTFLGDSQSTSSIRNLVDFCNQIIDRIGNMTYGKVIFKKEFSSRIIMAETNFDILEQILTQFLNNAIKFTPEGGKITIKLEEIEDKIVISVIDEGIGISEEEQEHLFELFYRANSVIGKYHGSGLGLSIAKNLADSINAEIKFKSQLGKGSEFSLIIPKV
jgi:signal transduction histidine kinase